MNIEEAKELLKDKDVMWNNPENNVLEAIETVLSELKKKDKVINEMAEWMAGGNKYIYATVEDVKEQFYNEVEREGK